VVTGFGYWSGQDVELEFRPAAADTGVVFVRRDLPGCPRIPVHPANRSDMPLRTNLCVGDATVEMVEHVLAALAGMHVDNCEVWSDRAEMPGCDGSGLAFVEALRTAGIVTQPAPRAAYAIRRPIRLGNEQSWIEARPAAPGRTVVQYELDYGSGNPIGRQSLEILLAPEFFHINLAPARTFMLEHEALALQSRGLGTRATVKDLLVFDAQGPVDNTLRFPDECVRHKVLDLVGDLALAGCDLHGRFLACRSGHRLNAELVRAILADAAEQAKSWKRCA